MSRYIDAELVPALFDEEYKETRKLIQEGETHLDNLAEGFSEAARVIRTIPTADVVEVVHASWNEDGRCSNCDWYMPFDCEGNGVESEYCPNCGAKMDRERREEQKDVSSKKFDAIMAKSIDLGKCPQCPDIGGEIIIPLICFGSKWRRVYIRCDHCGFETKSFDANTVLNDTESKRFGNFVIDKSLMNAIHNAVNDWNRRSANGT